MSRSKKRVMSEGHIESSGISSIVCAGAILKGSACLLRHITTENGCCVNMRYALL